jgi:hypothetical protein
LPTEVSEDRKVRKKKEEGRKKKEERRKKKEERRRKKINMSLRFSTSQRSRESCCSK